MYSTLSKTLNKITAGRRAFILQETGERDWLERFQVAGLLFFKGGVPSRAVERAIKMIKTLLSIDQKHGRSVGSARQKKASENLPEEAVKYGGAEEGAEAGKERGGGSQQMLRDRRPPLYEQNKQHLCEQRLSRGIN